MSARPQELAGVAEAETPRAGMFLWLKLLTVPDSGALRAQFKQEKVVVVPGALITQRMRCAVETVVRSFVTPTRAATTKLSACIKLLGHGGSRRTDCMSAQQMPMPGPSSKGCACIAGRISHVCGGDPSFQCPYLRCAWSAAKEEDLAEGMRRIGRAVRRHLGNSSGSSVAESAAQPALNGQMSRIQL